MNKKLPNANNYKKGFLSKDDKRYIEEMVVAGLEDVEIAQKLNRPPKQVRKYRLEFVANAPKITVARTETAEFKRELHASAAWTEIKQQFTQRELIFYENSYIEYRRQLKDISTTEKTQLHQLITIDITMNRLQIDRKNFQEEVDRLEKFIALERKKTYSSLSRDEKTYLSDCEAKVVTYKGLISQTNKEYQNFMDKHGDILKSLKSTRDQRMKNVEERGKFVSLLYELEINERRRSISQETALNDMAAQKEEERLSQPYQYEDGTIDIPLLNYETDREDID